MDLEIYKKRLIKNYHEKKTSNWMIWEGFTKQLFQNNQIKTTGENYKIHEFTIIFRTWADYFRRNCQEKIPYKIFCKGTVLSPIYGFNIRKNIDCKNGESLILSSKSVVPCSIGQYNII